MNYKQLTTEERYSIDVLFKVEKESISKIADILKRNKSTISREIKKIQLTTFIIEKKQNKLIKRDQHTNIILGG